MGADRGAEAFQSQFAELFEDETFAYAEVGNRVRYQDLFRLRMGAERRRMMWAQCKRRRCFAKHELMNPSPTFCTSLIEFFSVTALTKLSSVNPSSFAAKKFAAAIDAQSCPIKTDIWPNNNFRG